MRNTLLVVVLTLAVRPAVAQRLPPQLDPEALATTHSPAVNSAPTTAQEVAALQRGCDEGRMRDCRFLAGAYASGVQGVERDRARAMELYDGGCQAGDARACAYLAFMLMFEIEGGKDEERADVLFAKACDGGFASACTQLAAHEKTQRNPKRVAELYEKACHAGTPIACWFAGDMYRRGLRVDRNAARALPILEQGCKQGDGMCCLAAGKMHERGDATPTNPERAGELIARAEQLGTPEDTAIDGMVFRSWMATSPADE